MARKEIRLSDVEHLQFPWYQLTKYGVLLTMGFFGLWLFPPLSFPLRTGVLYSWGICGHH